MKKKLNYLNDKIIDFIIQNYHKIFLISIIILSFFIRLYFVPFRSPDYINHLRDWFTYFNNNGFYAFKNIYDIANYPALYLLILCINSFFPDFSLDIFPDLSTIFYIKIPSLLCDYLLAFIVYKILKEYKCKNYITLIAFSIILFSPIVIWNSSLLGQIDVIVSTFVIYSLYLFYLSKYKNAFLIYGVALAIKTTAIFVLPFIIILYIKYRFNILYFILIFIPHIIASIIASIFGCNFIKALTILGGQQFANFSNGAPTLANLIFSGKSFEQFYKWMFMSYFIIISIVFCAILLYFAIKNNLDKKFSFDLFVLWCLFISFSIPFLLPSIHERWFYTAEIFSIIYGFMRSKYFYIPILINFSTFSMYTVASFLQGNIASILMFITFIILIRVFIIENRRTKHLEE